MAAGSISGGRRSGLGLRRRDFTGGTGHMPGRQKLGGDKEIGHGTTASVDTAAKVSTVEGFLGIAGVSTTGTTGVFVITVTIVTTPGLDNRVGVVGL
ncbi:hypothetical protein TSUD_280970 [Trifolium subterraneum]|uniref:Uncharacterized protein n=1 Tax=Trifolium subterraneum TaxID=3900 RepID=A0A2Z6NSS3_TRISU|nr:hypothetical protein TSUD_280970 [Trifolium subterraneum]